MLPDRVRPVSRHPIDKLIHSILRARRQATQEEVAAILERKLMTGYQVSGLTAVRLGRDELWLK
jgi:hypothetical protein